MKSSIITIAIAAFTTLALAAPTTRNTLIERECDCDGYIACSDNCANGFALNSVGQGACILACSDANGCGTSAC
ncbi:Fc.00g027310.m01.CDS01 [Cosmosporella sp. VM-42]